jgi:hypothetical protein
MVTSRAAAVIAHSAHRSLSLRLSDVQAQLDSAAAACALKADEASHWEACMLEAEEQLHSERARSREMEAICAALLEQVEFLKDQEQQRHVALLSSASVASPSSPAVDPAVQDHTLVLLAEQILDARSQIVELQVIT